jgi:hypothetical protein
MRAVITVAGTAADTESLWDWLRREPALRGCVSAGPAPVGDGSMGTPIELVVAAAAAAGVLPALARVLSTWLVQRRSDIMITVTGTDGRLVSFDAKRIADPEALLRQVLDEPPGTAASDNC